MCDYELSLRNAAKQVWNGAAVKGCWFHYVQAIRRRIVATKSLSILIQKNKFAFNVMQMFFKLPLLPLKYMEKGYYSIMEYQKAHNLFEQFSFFNKYFTKTWKNKYSFSSLSVSNEVHRTNNFIESYNAKIKKIIFRNPSIYSFLSKKHYFTYILIITI